MRRHSLSDHVHFNYFIVAWRSKNKKIEDQKGGLKTKTILIDIEYGRFENLDSDSSLE